MIKTLIYKIHTEIGRFGGIFLLNDKKNAIFPAIPQLFQALKMHFQIPWLFMIFHDRMNPVIPAVATTPDFKDQFVIKMSEYIAEFLGTQKIQVWKLCDVTLTSEELKLAVSLVHFLYPIRG